METKQPSRSYFTLNYCTYLMLIHPFICGVRGIMVSFSWCASFQETNNRSVNTHNDWRCKKELFCSSTIFNVKIKEWFPHQEVVKTLCLFETCLWPGCDGVMLMFHLDTRSAETQQVSMQEGQKTSKNILTRLTFTHTSQSLISNMFLKQTACKKSVQKNNCKKKVLRIEVQFKVKKQNEHSFKNIRCDKTL